jgi:hypothetical protein
MMPVTMRSPAVARAGNLMFLPSVSIREGSGDRLFRRAGWARSPSSRAEPMRSVAYAQYPICSADAAGSEDSDRGAVALTARYLE